MPWLDGAWIEAGWHATSVVPFDVADRGLLLGDGVFDTALVLAGTMVWRDAHVERLVGSARTLGFTVDRARIEAAIDAVLAQTEFGTLRVTLTRGTGPRGLAPSAEARPTILAVATPLRAAALFAPVRLHPTATRRNETSPVSRVKSLNYLDGVLATREAIAAGRDDALFLNTRDRVACTSVGNVMLVVGDQLVTPPVEDGVVAGTVRRVLLATCEDLGLEPVERSLLVGDLDRADAILVTNSLRLVAPVSSLGRRDRNAPGRRTDALIAHLARLVREETGVDPRTLADA